MLLPLSLLALKEPGSVTTSECTFLLLRSSKASHAQCTFPGEEEQAGSQSAAASCCRGESLVAGDQPSPASLSDSRLLLFPTPNRTTLGNLRTSICERETQWNKI